MVGARPLQGRPRRRVRPSGAPPGRGARFADPGVIASMQPPHAAYTRDDHTDEWSGRLGEERASRAWRCRDLRDARAYPAHGSGRPAAHHDARQVLARPVPRAARRGPAGEQGEAGRIAPGPGAGLTAFAVGPVDAPADEAADAPIRLTVPVGPGEAPGAPGPGAAGLVAVGPRRPHRRPDPARSGVSAAPRRRGLPE
ncbi:hypothetical protein GCM10010393_60080 [Streptomyces gobitricini]|uniref:Uncharacterized protein n=1 Tax=Streptomyces gobitricini TaxID=68211 RepID=A0ABN3NCP1_9ACTN